MRQLSLPVVFAIVLPMITLLATHVWLRSAYTGRVFHLEGFLAQYGSGIYRYRILGKAALLAIYHLLSHRATDAGLSMPSDPKATRLFYLSYVSLDGICMFASNALLLLLLWRRATGLSDRRCAMYLFTWLILALSTYTVTPYDQLAYALMLVGLASARASSPWIAYGVVAMAAIFGALTRETEFLVSPALWTVAWLTRGPASKRYAWLGSVHVAFFAMCYVSLRVVVPGRLSVMQGMILGGGKTAIPGLIMLGLILFAGLTLYAREYSDRRAGVVFLALSCPYIVTSLLSGVYVELRLIVPLLLGLLFVHVQLANLKDIQKDATASAPSYVSA